MLVQVRDREVDHHDIEERRIADGQARRLEVVADRELEAIATDRQVLAGDKPRPAVSVGAEPVS